MSCYQNLRSCAGLKWVFGLKTDIRVIEIKHTKEQNNYV